MNTVSLEELNVYTNDVFVVEDKHYVTLYVKAEVDPNDEPLVREPDKCDGWEWFDWKDLPSPLFLPIVNLLQRGFDPR